MHESCSTDWNALVALEGAVTCTAAPDGRLWRNDGGNIGLAVLGGGATLSGIIAGLAAMGAPARRDSLCADLAAEVPMLTNQMRPPQ